MMHPVTTPRPKRPSKQALTDPEQEVISKLARDIRSTMKWSQAEMGRQLGVHQTTVARIEDTGGCTHQVAEAIYRLASDKLDYSLAVSTVKIAPDVYPNRGKAVTAALLIGLNGEAIARIQRLDDPNEGARSAYSWFQDIHALHIMGREGPSVATPRKK
jgi:DNA-binding XRE family transcriptional regulator